MMAAGSFVTWTHCSVRYEVTWDKTAHVRADTPLRSHGHRPIRTDAPLSPCRHRPIRADELTCPRPPSPSFYTPRPSLVLRGWAVVSAQTRERKKNKNLILNFSWMLAARKERKKMFGFQFSVFSFQSPRSPSSLSSTGFAGKAARRRRFFWPSSPSHPSKLYSSLGWLNSKVPKPFFPFTPRLIDVDGFYSWNFMEFREFN
jgi:hypothetical protein